MKEIERVSQGERQRVREIKIERVSSKCLYNDDDIDEIISKLSHK